MIAQHNHVHKIVNQGNAILCISKILISNQEEEIEISKIFPCLEFRKLKNSHPRPLDDEAPLFRLFVSFVSYDSYSNTIDYQPKTDNMNT